MTDMPTLDEIRADFVRGQTRNFDSYLMGRSLASEQDAYGAQFDAAVAAHDAQVLRDAADRALDEEVGIPFDSEYDVAIVSTWLAEEADRIAGEPST